MTNFDWFQIILFFAGGLDETVLKTLVAQHTEGRQFFILGQPRVNVFRLNLALDGLQ